MTQTFGIERRRFIARDLFYEVCEHDFLMVSCIWVAESFGLWVDYMGEWFDFGMGGGVDGLNNDQMSEFMGIMVT